MWLGMNQYAGRTEPPQLTHQINKGGSKDGTALSPYQTDSTPSEFEPMNLLDNL
jgi:hypothetical protein